jgi:arginase
MFGPTVDLMSERTFRVLGIPLRSGSLMPGSENDAPAYRKAGLVERLAASGRAAIDEGDLPVPSYLPHHTVPPLRNWPGPRVVWDLLADRLAPVLRQPGQIPLLVGCDCSVVVGTARALQQSTGRVHVLYIDGDYDDAPPDAANCQSAAAMAVWLLTHESPFWSGPALETSQVTVFGFTQKSRSPEPRPAGISLEEVRRDGAAPAAERALRDIPAGAGILVHFDTDVLAEKEFPAAYFPHQEGLTMAEIAGVLRVVLNDPRVRIVEISEYAALRDLDGSSISKLIETLANSLNRTKRAV